MKKYITTIVLAMLSVCVNAQYVTLTKENNGTNSLIVPSGECWQLITMSISCPTRSTFPLFSSTNSTDSTFLGNIYTTSGPLVSMEAASASTDLRCLGSVILGPAYLKYIEACQSYNLTFKKLSLGSSNSISATSVVIPTSVSGDVDVKMEQSADNVTWTECLPGAYNSSTVKRFFRLRAVEK